MKSKRFQKRIEDFICDKCGAKVIGNGYTDHCPNCLWGKHVDINPGDRAAECGGLMEPITFSIKNKVYRIEYLCQRCGYKFTVKAAEADNIDAIILLGHKQ